MPLLAATGVCFGVSLGVGPTLIITEGLNIDTGVGAGVEETPFVWLTTGCGVSGLVTTVGANVICMGFGGGDSVGVGYRKAMSDRSRAIFENDLNLLEGDCWGTWALRCWVCLVCDAGAEGGLANLLLSELAHIK